MTLAGPTVSFFAPPQGVALVVYLFSAFVLILAGIMALLLRNRARWIKETWKLCPVREGDTLAKLATKYKVPWKLIAKVNGIKPPYNIETTEIKLPPLNGHQSEERSKSPSERGHRQEPKRQAKQPTKSLTMKRTTERPPKKTTESSVRKRPPKRRI